MAGLKNPELRAIHPKGVYIVDTFHGRMEVLSYDDAPRADVLRRARIDANLSLRQGAERLGLSPRVLNEIENGRMEPVDPLWWGRLIARLVEPVGTQS